MRLICNFHKSFWHRFWCGNNIKNNIKPFPPRSFPVQLHKIKINLNFYFYSSLWCLKKFSEGLKGLHKPFETPQRSTKIKIKFNFLFSSGGSGQEGLRKVISSSEQQVALFGLFIVTSSFYQLATHCLQKQPPEVFYKKDVLRDVANFIGKHL